MTSGSPTPGGSSASPAQAAPAAAPIAAGGWVRVMRASSQTTTPTIAQTKTTRTRPPAAKAASAAPASTTPVVRRSERSDQRAPGPCDGEAKRAPGRSGHDGAETPLARAEGHQDLLKPFRREIRPESRGEFVFGIGRLPQKEIRYPALAGGADHQIGVGQIGGVKIPGEIVRRHR